MNGGAYFRNFTVCFYPVTSQDRNQFFTVNLQDGAERSVIAFFISWTSCTRVTLQSCSAESNFNRNVTWDKQAC